MKKILSISIFLITCTLVYSQETNEELLKKAETELSSALEKEDYEKAAVLKKEIETRKEIETAVANGDYESAAKLKKELEISNERGGVETNQTIESDTRGYNKMSPPLKGKAVVEIIRVTAIAWTYQFHVFCDGEFISHLMGVSHIRLDLEPGEHLIWTTGEKDHFVNITVEEGKTYFIYHDHNQGVWKADCDLTPVEPSDSDKISRGLSVILKHPNKVLDQKEYQSIVKKLEKKNVIQKSLDQYNSELKNDPKFSKTMKSNQYIPTQLL